MPHRVMKLASCLSIAVGLLVTSPAHSESDGADARATAELLSDPKYRFCNDPEYRLFKEQKEAFCATAHESESVCPNLVAACARPAWEEERKAESSGSLHLPAFLAPLFQLLFWAALALGFGLLLWNAWKVARSQSLDLGTEPKRQRPSPAEPLPVAHSLGSSREEFMLRAKEAASAQRYKEALLYLYQATLQGLSDNGWVRLRKSATSGDYGRTMRARLQGYEKGEIGSLDDVELAIAHLRTLERERFAHEARERETMELIDKTRALFHRWGSALVILLAWLAQGCEQQGFIEMPNETTSPGGTLLFEELVARHATSSLRRFRQVEALDEDTTAVIVMGGALEQSEWNRLDAWVQAGGELVVVGSPEKFGTTFGVTVSTKICEDELITAGARVSTEAQWLAFDQQEGYESYFLCGEAPIILGLTHGEGWVTMVATKALIHNARLAEAEHAELMMDSLLLDDAHVELLGPWTGRGSSSPLQSMIKGNFGWWVLHVLLFFAVAAWGWGRRFGRPSDPPTVHRRSFREHALALANQYQRAGAHAFVLQRFVEWSSERLRHTGASGTQTRQDLNTEFAAALSNSETASPGHKSAHAASPPLKLYEKLRLALARRPAHSSSAQEKD